jgi:hypothetical protein
LISLLGHIADKNPPICVLMGEIKLLNLVMNLALNLKDIHLGNAELFSCVLETLKTLGSIESNK